MDLIYTDVFYKELGYLKQCEIDMELGSFIMSSSNNTFQIVTPIEDLPPEIENGCLIYEIDTEIGGIVNGIGADTLTNKAYIYGITWRGMLQRKYIEPPKGQAYYLARGDANTVIRDLIDTQYNGLIVGSQEDSGILVNKDFRFSQVSYSIEEMLVAVNSKISIKSVRSDGKIKIIVSALPIKNLSDDIELNNDYGISMIAKKIKNGVNHVICLGKGELVDRTVIHLFKLPNGMITTDEKEAIKGINENTIVYDYSSVENEQELIEGGKKKFNEYLDEESLEIKVNKNVEIGDIVAARERTTGIYMKKQVSQKIIKGFIDSVKIEYKVGE